VLICGTEVWTLRRSELKNFYKELKWGLMMWRWIFGKSGGYSVVSNWTSINPHCESNGCVKDDVTWPQKGQGCDPRILEAQYLDNRARYIVGSYWLPIENCTLGVQWPTTSREPDRSKSWHQCLWSLISQKPCETHGCLKLTTYLKPHIAKLMVTWLMMSLVANGDCSKLGFVRNQQRL